MQEQIGNVDVGIDREHMLKTGYKNGEICGNERGYVGIDRKVDGYITMYINVSNYEEMEYKRGSVCREGYKGERNCWLGYTKTD